MRTMYLIQYEFVGVKTLRFQFKGLGGSGVSQEKVLEALEGLGLEKLEAQVYVFLGKRGPQKAMDIVKASRITRQHLYEILKTLQRRGLVSATLEHPARFSAMPFEKALDLFVKAKMEEAQRLKHNKTEILSNWKNISVAETSDQSPKFTVIEGRKHIYPKLMQMIEETEHQLSFVTTVPSLVRVDQFRLFDAAFSHPKRSRIKFKFITDLSDQNVTAMKAILKQKPKANFSFEGRAPDLGLRSLPRIILRDEKEAIFFIDPKPEVSTSERDYVCLWTNCKTLVDSFSAMFEDLWSNSTDIEKKIDEIETGKPTPKTCVFAEAKKAKEKYDETLRSARKEIVMMTSSKGLIALDKSLPMLKGLVSKGVSVKIMASIVNENLEAAQPFLKHWEVRHVPEVYLGATIVDGQHFFQFKNPTSDPNDADSLEHFENTFYTSDAEYVRKMENMLNDIWKNAQVPSPISLKAVMQQPLSPNKPDYANVLDEYKSEFKRIVGFSYLMEPQEGKITEREVLGKIADAKRIPAKDPKKDIIRIYGAQGIAVIYPPKNLDLPNFMIFVSHANRQSSFGAANSLFIYMQAKIADNQSYFPVAFATDNPKGYRFRKGMLEIHRTTEVAKLLKKDELKVQAQGNRLFAGWTVPIPLLPPRYILPPGCIMFEGYGKVKSVSSKIIGPLNRRLEYEENILDAFVTFMNPSLRYYGPGSDGLLHRDMITTSYPITE
jgi:sugar-specific transcriptional regulator TrmB